MGTVEKLAHDRKISDFLSYTKQVHMNDTMIDPAEMTEDERMRLIYEADYYMPSNEIYEVLPEDLFDEF